MSAAPPIITLSKPSQAQPHHSGALIAASGTRTNLLHFLLPVCFAALEKPRSDPGTINMSMCQALRALSVLLTVSVLGIAGTVEALNLRTGGIYPGTNIGMVTQPRDSPSGDLTP